MLISFNPSYIRVANAFVKLMHWHIPGTGNGFVNRDFFLHIQNVFTLRTAKHSDVFFRPFYGTGGKEWT